MKKLTAIIITFIFIFNGTGYCLRPELSFSAQRKSPDYLCRILAEYIGKSMRESMDKNKALNTRALDIGVTYIELTPKRLLKESIPEESYNNLVTQIEENDIKMDIDKEGSIWISCEPRDVYIKINKDGYYRNRIKSEFYNAVERENKIKFKEELHTDINLAVEGLKAFHVFIDSLPQNLKNRIKDLLWLRAVYAGITPVTELFSDPLLKYIDLSDRQRLISAVTANSDFLIVKYDTERYFIINVKAASGVIRNNEDIFPSKALHRTRKWLQKHSWQWLDTQDNSISALLRGVPRNAADKLPLFYICVNKVLARARSEAPSKTLVRNTRLVLEQIKANSKGQISGRDRKHCHDVIKSIMKNSLSDEDIDLLLDSFNIDIRIIKYRGFEEQDVIWAQDLERIFNEAVDIVEKRVEAVSLAAVPSVNIYADEKLIEDLHERLKSEPKNLFVRHKLANELIKTGRIDEAIGICKDMLAVILEHRPEMDIDFADKNERMTDNLLVTAYIHAGRFDEAIELGLETVKKFPKDVIARNNLITAYAHACRFNEAIKSALGATAPALFPEDTVLKRILMNAYMHAGRFNEAIELGLEVVRKDPKDMYARDLLTNAYINKAEKNVIIGEPYEKDYLAAMDLRPDDLTIKHRLIYLGLLPEDMNGIRDNNGILERVVNIDTKEEYALTKARFDHIVSKHVNRAISGAEIVSSSFPADIDVNIVKELILEAVKYGIKFNEKLPWWHHGTIIWYVGDNRPDLAKKTGIERIEIKVEKGRILTAFPVIGKGVDIYKGDFKIDAALNNVLPSTSFFMWNANSKERISVLAGRDKWGVGAMVFNEAVFGKAAPLIQREYIMWQALWKGEFVGYQKAKNGAKSGARALVYVEFYKYEIPDELMAKYSFSNKTIYFYVDYVSRRLINVMADKPYIDSAKIGEPEIKLVDSLRSPALHIKDETVIAVRGYSGLENSVYMPVIKKGIDEGNFYAVKVEGGKFKPVKLLHEETGQEKGRDIHQKDLDILNNLKDIELPEGAIILFINGLDHSLYYKIDYKSRPENCFGSHYGIERNQYYIDARHLFNTRALKAHISHEFEEREAVLKGLSEEEKLISAKDRPPELQEKINRLAKESHIALAQKEDEAKNLELKAMERALAGEYKDTKPIFIEEEAKHARDYNNFENTWKRKIEDAAKGGEKVCFYGNFKAIGYFSSLIVGVSEDSKKRSGNFKILLNAESGIAGFYDTPEVLNQKIKEIMNKQGKSILIDVELLSRIADLYNAGYVQAIEILEDYVVKDRLLLPYERFAGFLKIYREHKEKIYKMPKDDPEEYFLREKVDGEQNDISKLFALFNKTVLRKHLRKYLLGTDKNIRGLIYDLEGIFRVERYHDATFINMLWDIYLDSNNTSRENQRFLEILVYEINHNLNIGARQMTSRIGNILGAKDLNATYKAIDVLLRLKVRKEDNNNLIGLTGDALYKKEIIACFALLNKTLFGVEEKEYIEREGFGGESISPVAACFNPDSRNIYYYLLKMQELNSRGGVFKSDVDTRILNYTIILDNGVRLPSQRKTYTWFSSLREQTHNRVSSGNLRVVKKVLYFWKELNEDIIRDDPWSLVSEVKKDIGESDTKMYSDLINNMLRKLKEEGRITSLEGDKFLEDMLNIPEGEAIEALEIANQGTDEKAIEKVRYMIGLYYAFSERYGIAHMDIIPKIKGAVGRWEEEIAWNQAHMKEFTQFMEKPYKALMSCIDTNDHHAIFASIAECRNAIKHRLLFDKIEEDRDKARLLELDYNMYLLGKEMMTRVLNDINQCKTIDNLKGYIVSLVSMGKFLSASELGGVDFEQFIYELEKGRLKYSQVHDLTRALRAELHKISRKINEEMRFSMSHIFDNLETNDLTDEWQGKAKSEHVKGESGYEIEVVSEEGREEMQGYVVDNLIRDAGINLFDEALTRFNDLLEIQLTPGKDKSVKEESAEKEINLDEQFFRFGTPDIIPRDMLLSEWSKKGLNLVIMTQEGIDVPPGVVISARLITRPKVFKSKAFEKNVLKEIDIIRKHAKYPDLKLLLYARSGSAFMLPGLLVTIPNLGMNDKEAEELTKVSGDEWFAYDTYMGFIRSFAVNIIGISEEYFQEALDKQPKPKDELNGSEMKALCQEYKDIVDKYGKGQKIPEQMIDQVMMAIDTVYDSWDSEDAKEYRARHKISQEWGSVVILQKGVFGNLNPTKDGKISGTGAGSLRILPDGREIVSGRFRFRSIGEQIMTGAEHNYILLSNFQKRNSKNQTLEDLKPELYEEILNRAHRLKDIFGNNQMFEFTVELNKTWVTQSNDDLVLDDFPEFIDSADNEPIARGHGVSGGALRGWAANSFESAKALLEKYKSERPEGIDGVMLFLDRVNPEMINAIPEGVHIIARVISVHAETLAQKSGITAVYGLPDMRFNNEEGIWYIGSHKMMDGNVISVDGHENQLIYHNSGKIFLGSLPLREASDEKTEIERSSRAAAALTDLAEMEGRERRLEDEKGFSEFEQEVLSALEDAMNGRIKLDELKRYATNYKAILDTIAKKCQGLDFTLYGERFEGALKEELGKIDISVELFRYLNSHYLPRTTKYTGALNKIADRLDYKPPEQEYPEEILAYNTKGEMVKLTVREIMNREWNDRCLMLHEPARNIKLVSFEFDNVLETMLKHESIGSLERFFQSLKSMGLKIAITTRNPTAVDWLKNYRPEIYELFDYAYADRDNPNLEEHYVNGLGLEPGEIMHIGNNWTDFYESHSVSMHRQGFVGVVFTGKIDASIKDIMNQQIDAVILNTAIAEEILELIKRWVNVGETMERNTGVENSL